jgi:serine protease inhibitor
VQNTGAKMTHTRAAIPLALLVPLVGCADILAPRGPDAEPLAVHLDQRLVQAYTDFGFELFRRLHHATPDSNLVVSPVSTAFALAMTHNGAAGETRRAIAATLGVENIPLDQLNRSNRDWLASLRSTGDEKVQLALANSLWAREGFPFLPDFVDRKRSDYDATVTELPFDDAAVRAINDWVATNTQGKIETILDAIPPNAVLYLLNALYFQAQWTHRFEIGETREEPFTRLDGTAVPVPLMRQMATIPYHRGDGFHLIALPYAAGRFSMVLALPDEKLGLEGFYALLTTDSWDTWISQVQPTNLHLVLPRFRLEWQRSLLRTLAEMGMEIAFTGDADFSAMTPGGGLYISEVEQRTYIEVNEEGTEAAAVTLVEMSRTSMGPPSLRFDRPFFFAIRDDATGTLLFLGSVVDPAVPG